MTQIISGRSCRTCCHSLTESTPNGLEMVCRRMPPSVTPVLGPGPNGQGITVVGKVSMYPKVEPEWTCGEYRRLMIANEGDVRPAPALVK